MAERKLSDGERINAVQNAFIDKLNQILDFIPGYRGYRKGVENVVNMAQGNPSNYSAADYARDLGYSMVPFYGAYDNAINDQPQDWKGNALEAVMLGIPFKAGNRTGLIRVPGHSGRRTNGQIPIDDVRTAEFREKLQEAIDRGPTTTRDPYTHTTRRSLDHFQKMLDAGDAPIKEGLADRIELRNAGLEEYYPDIVQRHAAPTRGREINPEDYITYTFEHPEVRHQQPWGWTGNSAEQPLGTRLLEQEFNARNPDRTLKVFDFDELADTYNNLIELPQYQRPNNQSFTDALIEMYNRERWKPAYGFRDKLNRVGQPYQYTEREITSMHPTNGELMGEYNTAYYGGGVPQRMGGRLTSEDPVKQRIIDILESDLTAEAKRFRINQLLNQ